MLNSIVDPICYVDALDFTVAEGNYAFWNAMGREAYTGNTVMSTGDQLADLGIRVLIDDCVDKSSSGSIGLWLKLKGRKKSFYDISCHFAYGNKVVLFFHDVTSMKQREEFAKFQANHDSLTGLPNRDQLMKKLNRQIETRRRNESIVLFFMDLNRFKYINDNYGHDAGDKVLELIAARLVRFIREQDDMAVRLGGDEFVIMFSGVMNDATEFAKNKAVELTKVIRKPFTLIKNGERHLSFVGCSIGVSTLPKAKTAKEMLKRSDRAMYFAKEHDMWYHIHGTKTAH